MRVYFVKAGKIPVAGLAIDHRQNFRLLEMACFARHLHHRSRRVNPVAGDTVERRPVACPVAKAAEDSFMGSLKRPRMPGF